GRRLGATVRLRPDGELHDDVLRLREADRDVYGGVIEQLARAIADRHLRDVHEVHVRGTAVVGVFEPILPRLPEITVAVAHGRGAPALLAQVLRGCRGEVRLAAFDQDMVDRREDVLNGVVAAPR